MSLHETIAEITARLKAGVSISRDEATLVHDYIFVLAEELNTSRKHSHISDQIIAVTTRERDEARAERDALKRSEEVSEEVIRGLRQQLFSERPDLRELQALENELDSLWGIWNDAGRGRYVKLG